MAQRATLLEAMWEGGGDAELILERLESGDLRLIGNFMGSAAIRFMENFPPSVVPLPATMPRTRDRDRSP